MEISQGSNRLTIQPIINLDEFSSKSAETCQRAMCFKETQRIIRKEDAIRKEPNQDSETKRRHLSTYSDNNISHFCQETKANRNSSNPLVNGLSKEHSGDGGIAKLSEKRSSDATSPPYRGRYHRNTIRVSLISRGSTGARCGSRTKASAPPRHLHLGGPRSIGAKR